MNSQDIVAATDLARGACMFSSIININGYTFRRRWNKFSHKHYYSIEKNHELIETFDIPETWGEKRKIVRTFLKMSQGFDIDYITPHQFSIINLNNNQKWYTENRFYMESEITDVCKNIGVSNYKEVIYELREQHIIFPIKYI